MVFFFHSVSPAQDNVTVVLFSWCFVKLQSCDALGGQDLTYHSMWCSTQLHRKHSGGYLDKTEPSALCKAVLLCQVHSVPLSAGFGPQHMLGAFEAAQVPA